MNNKDQVLSQLEDLDIILFKGENYFYSYVVEYFTWSNFSHIGIVLKAPTYISPELTGIYLLESGAESTPDCEDHKIKFGVQLTDLNTLLDSYTGRIYYRKLQCKIRDPATDLHQKILSVHKEIYDKPYDDKFFDLLRAAVDVEIGDCQSIKAFFCSALVAFIYTKLGLLPATTDWSIVQPKYFGPKQTIEKTLIDSSFKELVQIK